MCAIKHHISFFLVEVGAKKPPKCTQGIIIMATRARPKERWRSEITEKKITLCTHTYYPLCNLHSKKPFPKYIVVENCSGMHIYVL